MQVLTTMESCQCQLDVVSILLILNIYIVRIMFKLKFYFLDAQLRPDNELFESCCTSRHNDDSFIKN